MTAVAILTASGVVEEVSRRDDEALLAALAARDVEARVLSWLRHPIPPEVVLCVVRSAYDWAARRERFLAFVDSTAGKARLWNPPEVLRRGSDKAYLLHLAARGVPIVPTTLLAGGSPAALPALFAAHGGERLVLKPAVGVAARQVVRVSRDTQAAGQAHLDRLLARGDALAQPYFPSVETEGELSLVFVDGEPTHALRKTPRAGDFRAMFLFGCAEAPVEASAAETALARRAIEAFGGGVKFGRVDLLRAPEGDLRVSEVEVVSPTLYFAHGPAACERLADAIAAAVKEVVA